MIGADRNAWLPRERALALAADVAGVTVDDIRGPSIRKELVRARALFFGAVRLLGQPASLSALGRDLGGRDHSTIRNLERVANELLADDSDFAAEFDRLTDRALGQLVRATAHPTLEMSHARH